MADNNKVTIDAAFFSELFRKANETDAICKECCEEHTAEEFNALAKERDELKAKLAGECKNCVSQDEAKVLAESLAAAERCIEDVWNCLSPQEIADNEYAHIDIIRAYREKKEAK